MFFSPLLDVRMLMGVVHMKPFLTHMTCPLTMNAPSAHVLAMLCVLGLLCRSVLLLAVKLCCGTALTALQTVYQYVEVSWQPHECSITGDYCALTV